MKSVNTRTGAIIHFFFRSLKAWRASSMSSNSSFFNLLALPSSRSFRGLAILEYPSMNCQKKPVMLVKCRISVYVFGGAISAIALRFAVPGFMPSTDISWPRNVISSWRKWHLEGFSFSPCSRNRPKTTRKWWRCSSSVREKTIMSSR